MDRSTWAVVDEEAREPSPAERRALVAKVQAAAQPQPPIRRKSRKYTWGDENDVLPPFRPPVLRRIKRYFGYA